MNQLVERLQSDEVSRVLADNCVILAYLFGSQARGDTWAQSDIDIAVLFADEVSKEKRFELDLTLNHKLAIVLQRDDIQIVELQQAPPFCGTGSTMMGSYYIARMIPCA